jgi:hypothetical protein
MPPLLQETSCIEIFYLWHKERRNGMIYLEYAGFYTEKAPQRRVE